MLMEMISEARSMALPPSFGLRGLSRFVQEQPVIAAALLVALAAVLLWPYRHFAGDDAHITFRFARNFAEGGGYVYNPGVPTYGSTAPLWVFLLAGLHRLGPTVPDAAHLLNWIFALADIVLFFRLALLYLGRNAAAFIAALLFVADPWFIRWGLSGMENPLALCLLMGMLLSQMALRNSGRVNWAAPACAALAGLCRPEMSLLCGLLLLDNLLLERRRLLANLLTALTAYTLVFGPWFAYALASFHTIIPNTITAKITSAHLLAAEHVGLYFATFWIFQALAVAVVVLSRPLLQSFASRYEGSLAIWFLPLAWALILPAFYVAGGAPVAGRYMMFGLPCYLLIGVAAWTVLADRFPRLVSAAIACTLLLMAFVQYRYCWYITRWPQGMDPRMIHAALTLKQISQSTDVVAADQIGVLGYYSERPVLDTQGLVSPEVMQYRRMPVKHAVWHYAYQRRVQYMFVISTIAQLAAVEPAYKSLTLIESVDVQREGASQVDAPEHYYLYKTNW
jgi:hypothetical protein